MTYRTYLVVLLSVVGLAQTTAAVQWTLFEQDAALAAATASAASVSTKQVARPVAALSAAGGVSVPPLRQVQGAPGTLLASEVAALLAAPLPEAPPALPEVRHEAPCDTITTTADICVAPPDALPE